MNPVLYRLAVAYEVARTEGWLREPLDGEALPRPDRHCEFCHSPVSLYQVDCTRCGDMFARDWERGYR